MKNNSPYYPLFLNIAGKKCVVVGGGQVALRKVQAFLNHGAEVKVISPDLSSGLNRLAEDGKITVLRRRYQCGDLSDTLIVVAATNDPSINLEVSKEAQASGILVNVVDDAAHSDFIVPSSMHRGDITIAISTAGKSPALARKIRTRLEKEFGEEYAILTDLIDEVRTELKKQGISLDGDAWQDALDLDSLIALITKGESKKAKAALLKNLNARKTLTKSKSS